MKAPTHGIWKAKSIDKPLLRLASIVVSRQEKMDGRKTGVNSLLQSISFFHKSSQLAAETLNYGTSSEPVFLSVVGESGFLRCLREGYTEMQGSACLFCTLLSVPWPLPSNPLHGRQPRERAPTYWRDVERVRPSRAHSSFCWFSLELNLMA